MKALLLIGVQDDEYKLCGIFEDKVSCTEIVKKYIDKMNEENNIKYTHYELRYDINNDNWDILNLYTFKDGTIHENCYYCLEFSNIELNELRCIEV